MYPFHNLVVWCCRASDAATDYLDNEGDDVKDDEEEGEDRGGDAEKGTGRGRREEVDGVGEENIGECVDPWDLSVGVGGGGRGRGRGRRSGRGWNTERGE